MLLKPHGLYTFGFKPRYQFHSCVLHCNLGKQIVKRKNIFHETGRIIRILADVKMLIPLAPGSRKPLITIEEYVPEYLLTKLHIKYTYFKKGCFENRKSKMFKQKE